MESGNKPQTHVPVIPAGAQNQIMDIYRVTEALTKDLIIAVSNRRNEKKEEEVTMTMCMSKYKAKFGYKVDVIDKSTLWEIYAQLYEGDRVVYDRASGGNGPVCYTRCDNVYVSYVNHMIDYVTTSAKNAFLSELEKKIREELHRAAWGSPFGILYHDAEAMAKNILQQMRCEEYNDDVMVKGRIEHVVGQFSNKLILTVTSGEKTPDGRYAVWRPSSFKHVGIVHLIDARLLGKPLIGVKIERTAKGTAWKVLPGGGFTILSIYGEYMRRGKWATEYRYNYVEQLYRDEIEKHGGIVTWSHCGASRGGGLGACAHVVALPLTLKAPIALGRVWRTVSDSQVEERTLFSNGLDFVLDLGDV